MPEKQKDNPDMMDFENYSRNLEKAIDLYNRATEKALEYSKDAKAPLTYSKMMDTYGEIFSKLLQDPDKLYKKQIDLYSDYMRVWGNAWNRYLDIDEEPLFSGAPKDKRFKDETWDRDLTFDFIKQSYFLTNQWLEEIIADIEGIDKKTLDKFKFYTTQFSDALSPSNFAHTNPAVIRETFKTNGENLLKGMENLVSDLEKSKDIFQITIADSSHFKLGENIAATPGKVIYKNDLMELIQYQAKGDKVFDTPILMVPAWINKYYILDLSENNSFVKWATDLGYNVFMVSWVNPTQEHSDKQFEDYVQDGAIKAIEKTIEASGQPQISLLGYCLGGSMLSCALSYLKSENKDYIKNVTLLTTMLDFDYVGDMSIFIDEDQIDEIEKSMAENGYLDGKQMSAIFSAMRANDLIWSFVVNNYLMGRSPIPFDILYWNADATRMPAKTHSFYLRKMYLENSLKEPDSIEISGKKIDINKVDIPAYILATQEDHIAPWETCFKTSNILSGKNKFVLAGSGHVAGVVNPPVKNKYGYYIADLKTDDAEKWLQSAQYNKGSWWNDWHEWNKSFSKGKVKAKKIGANGVKPLYDAPGEYVKQQ